MKAYKFNNVDISNLNENEINIVIIIAYAYPDIQTDFDEFCKLNNIPSKTINIVKINENTPSNSDWITEICLDTQWSHAIFPKSNITVVEAESDKIIDLLVAIEVGKRLNPDIINMSFGVSEFNNCEKIDIFDNSDILFVASSGDNNVVEWPSSNPNVLAVGATSLYLNKNNSISMQQTWMNTGCGYSNYFKIPNYQLEVNYTTQRSTVDLSIVGNPDTGCLIYTNGDYIVIGGTSLSAPIISGMFALINAIRKKNNKKLFNTNQNSNLSVQNILYNNFYKDDIFYDIIQGTSGQYSATPGYDLPTGLGTPKFCNFICFLENM
jgi:subtilase family serine protease